MSKRNIIWLLMAFFFIADLAAAVHKGKKEVVLSEQSLRDKVKGAWAGQTLGCSYGDLLSLNSWELSFRIIFPFPGISIRSRIGMIPFPVCMMMFMWI